MIKNISKSSFKAYGTVLEFSENPEDPRFEVIITEENHPWRLAVLRVVERSFNKLECHTMSLESFEPISGTGLLIVAEHEKPSEFEVFLLDKPVCLNKGIWHQMITLSAETIVKIAENLEVSSEFFYLERDLELKF
ncbi:hypothetical protein [Paenibacillus sp.]|uniref:hypothetical protein n=1 Tax=Paenibacillus sp. TaxID=58172 RepID=UPI0028AFEE2C|nr:hypothetical protein [Paenibacillus sp.]